MWTCCSTEMELKGSTLYYTRWHMQRTTWSRATEDTDGRGESGRCALAAHQNSSMNDRFAAERVAGTPLLECPRFRMRFGRSPDRAYGDSQPKAPAVRRG